MNFDLHHYLERLGINDSIKVNEKSLFDIQTHQLRAVTFENLDCLMDKDILLDSTFLQKKNYF